MERRDQFFQFWEEDAHQSGYRLLQLGPFVDFVKSVSGYGTTERAIEGRLYRIKRKLRKVLGGDFNDG